MGDRAHVEISYPGKEDRYIKKYGKLKNLSNKGASPPGAPRTHKEGADSLP